MTHWTSPARPYARAAVLVALVIGAYLGWREFWFLTDDAFITFRYISNHQHGWGYTWNPPPFHHVEGYSNFSWMVLLEAIWRVFGSAPPAAANWVSLAFSYVTLALAFTMTYRLGLPAPLTSLRFAIASAVVLAILLNRTFLAWMSSGLETALFATIVLAWVFCLVEMLRSSNGTVLLWIASAMASLAALTRPDGYLLIAATICIGAWILTQRPTLAAVLALTPNLGAAAHLAWRRSYYGEYLPNTYFAKHAGAWPESGVRYAASFVLEYALWIWIAVALLFLFASRPTFQRLRATIPLLVAVVTFVAHFAYYTFVIGGDHFEYRVYAHLVPLLWVSFAAMLARLCGGARRLVATFATFLLLSLPVPWTHYALTRSLSTREETFRMFRPVAGSFPGPVRFYAEWFDSLQSWLIPRAVGMRHQEHRIFFRWMSDLLPSREAGARLWSDASPMLVLVCAGVPGWVFPQHAIIDILGLNDRVVARAPVRGDRIMAHDRRPPPGYVECLNPGGVRVMYDDMFGIGTAPTSPERIRACESRYDGGYQGTE